MNSVEISELLQKESQAILNIPITEEFDKAISLIVEQVHHKKGKLVSSGMGKAGQIAMNISTTLSSTGTPSVFVHAAEAQHGDLGIIQENDVMLLVSNSGKTREICDLVHLVRRMHADMQFIVITANKDSELAKEATAILLTGNPAEVCPLGMAPTTSTTVMTVIGDLLVVGTMKRINFTNEEYAKRHHGGYLGEKSRSLS